jgi:hypothetical protein
MLRWISIVGGLLIMMGHHARSEALFYYFRLEEQAVVILATKVVSNVVRVPEEPLAQPAYCTFPVASLCESLGFRRPGGFQEWRPVDRCDHEVQR